MVKILAFFRRMSHISLISENFLVSRPGKAIKRMSEPSFICGIFVFSNADNFLLILLRWTAFLEIFFETDIPTLTSPKLFLATFKIINPSLKLSLERKIFLKSFSFFKRLILGSIFLPIIQTAFFCPLLDAVLRSACRRKRTACSKSRAFFFSFFSSDDK